MTENRNSQQEWTLFVGIETQLSQFHWKMRLMALERCKTIPQNAIDRPRTHRNTAESHNRKGKMQIICNTNEKHSKGIRMRMRCVFENLICSSYAPNCITFKWFRILNTPNAIRNGNHACLRTKTQIDKKKLRREANSEKRIMMQKSRCWLKVHCRPVFYVFFCTEKYYLNAFTSQIDGTHKTVKWLTLISSPFKCN